MEGTHVSSMRDQEPIHYSRKNAGRRVTTKPESSRLQQKGEQHQLLQAQDNFMVHGSLVAPRQHSNDVNEKDSKESGRERLKRHREEVAGKVLIPDSWGQESRLKDWIDYTSFDKLLAPNGLASAREALVAEGRRASTSQRLRIESRC